MFSRLIASIAATAFAFLVGSMPIQASLIFNDNLTLTDYSWIILCVCAWLCAIKIIWEDL